MEGVLLHIPVTYHSSAICSAMSHNWAQLRSVICSNISKISWLLSRVWVIS